MKKTLLLTSLLLASSLSATETETSERFSFQNWIESIFNTDTEENLIPKQEEIKIDIDNLPQTLQQQTIQIYCGCNSAND